MASRSPSPSESRSHTIVSTPSGSGGRLPPVPAPSLLPRLRTVHSWPAAIRCRTVGAPCSPEPPMTSVFIFRFCCRILVLLDRRQGRPRLANEPNTEEIARAPGRSCLEFVTFFDSRTAVPAARTGAGGRGRARATRHWVPCMHYRAAARGAAGHSGCQLVQCPRRGRGRGAAQTADSTDSNTRFCEGKEKEGARQGCLADPSRPWPPRPAKAGPLPNPPRHTLR